MKFEEDPYVHGLVCSLQEKFGIAEDNLDVYRMLVYGQDVYLDTNGNFDAKNPAFFLTLLPPNMPGGVPYAVFKQMGEHTGDTINGETVPLFDEDEPLGGQIFMSFANSEDRHTDDDWRVDDFGRFADEITEKYDGLRKMPNR